MKRKDVIDDMQLYQDELIKLVEIYFVKKTKYSGIVDWIFQDQRTWFKQVDIIYGTDMQCTSRVQALFNVSGFNITKKDDNIIILNLGNLGVTTWATKQWRLDNMVGVMLHELAHCLVNDHDDEFYELLEQLDCNVIADDTFVTISGETYRTEKWPTIITLEQLHKIKEK